MNSDRDIVLFYYYSNKIFPDSCQLGISNDLAHRNLFMFPTARNIHFEFPSFEDFTYSSLCNTEGVNRLAGSECKEKYILLRTTEKCNPKSKKYCVGFFKVKRIYYQKTNYFDNNGYVVGFESSEVKLLERNSIPITQDKKGIHRKYNVSWSTENMNQLLNDYLDEIKKSPHNFKDQYKKETIDMIKMIQDQEKVQEWKKLCDSCDSKMKCALSKYRKRYKGKVDLYDAIHNVYTSNLYSKSILNSIQKQYLW